MLYSCLYRKKLKIYAPFQPSHISRKSPHLVLRETTGGSLPSLIGISGTQRKRYYFLLIFIYLFIYFWLPWVFLAVWAFSGCHEPWLLPSPSTQASHCRGFTCWGAQPLGCVGSVVVIQGLSCMWILPTRDHTHVPCTGRQILNHWTIRVVW